MSRIRQVLGRIKDAWGWSGFAAGLAGGAVLALVGANYLLDRPGRDALEDGTIVILSSFDESIGEQQLALVEQWNAINPEHKAEFRALRGVADDHYSEMVGQAEASKSDVDIFSLDVPWVAEFADRGFLREMPVTDEDLDGFLAQPLETCRWGGKLWALPFYTNAGLLYYRSDLITDLQPPTGWQQLTNDITEAFNSIPEGKRPAAGYAGQFADYEGLTVNALEAIWAAGGDVVDREGNVVVDSPEAREGLRRLAVGLAHTNPQVIDRDARTYHETETTQTFREGRLLFMRNWPLALRDLDTSTETKTISYNVVPLPGPSVLGGQNLAIASSTDQPAAAKALIQFLTSPRSQQILFERGGFAATRELVYHDGSVKERYPYAQTLLSALRIARPRPVTPHYAQFTKTFREGVNQALSNDGELPDDFTSRLDAALDGRTP
ncbi:extracellular solute-binding protein [Phytohabitans houttuyneae]|uniref:ABC transporter substrate-binding protein n=1 Tax=Phytohabitans houttuyneae TaxID=1076126 RepID=A0A6V8KHB8_9ACTN|nr:extracellular solute-binding protein [Phytohabitans houttuyneae]GFJ80115.1 ABC transporter substrate-binding protein [Phytohabitans houttuyneae]